MLNDYIKYVKVYKKISKNFFFVNLSAYIQKIELNRSLVALTQADKINKCPSTCFEKTIVR